MMFHDVSVDVLLVLDVFLKGSQVFVFFTDLTAHDVTREEGAGCVLVMPSGGRYYFNIYSL